MTLRLLAPALAATASLAVAASAQAGAVATCHGLKVTTSTTSGTITGTAGRDVIRLTGPGTVASGAGPDVICGSRFADRIDAGPGDDVVIGGSGHDRIDGGAGRDSLFGEGGNDHLVGGAGRDVLHGGAGRNRVVRVGMPRVAGEHGLLAGRDVVMQGTYAVSILTDSSSVWPLVQAGQQFEFTWLPQPQAAPVAPLWATARPLQSTVASVGQGIAGYWASTGLVLPGVMVDASEVRSASWGQRMTLDQLWGNYGLSAPAPGAPGTFTLEGGPGMPLAPTIAGGLAMEGNANGVEFMRPAQVVQAQPNLATQWPSLSRMRVSVGRQYDRPGEVVDMLNPPSQFVDVTFTPKSPTATLRYIADAGFFGG